MKVRSYELFLGEDVDPDLVIATVDIECEKITAPKGQKFAWASGETNGRRWQPFMVGVGRLQAHMIDLVIVCSFDEMALMKEVDKLLQNCVEETEGKIAQNSLNRFDEMILKGQFVNGRRPPTRLSGGWPCLPLADLEFYPVPRSEVALPRGEDIDWRQYPALARKDEEVIWDHCARDCVENLLRVAGLSFCREDVPAFWRKPGDFPGEYAG